MTAQAAAASGAPLGFPALNGALPQAVWPEVADGVLVALNVSGNRPTTTARYVVASYEQAVGLSADGWYSDTVRQSIANVLGVPASSLPVPWSGPNG